MTVRIIQSAQPTAAKRRVFFQLVDATDGFTPETGEAGGQPQISVDGAAFTNTGIGVLVHLGNGRYYAELTQGVVITGEWIETRYKSANTREAEGTSVQVVGYDPDNDASLGLSNLDAKVSAVVDDSVLALAAQLAPGLAAMTAAMPSVIPRATYDGTGEFLSFESGGKPRLSTQVVIKVYDGTALIALDGDPNGSFFELADTDPAMAISAKTSGIFVKGSGGNTDVGVVALIDRQYA